MNKKIRAIILATVLCLSFSLATFSQVSAENRHILRKYSFNADGSLANRMAVDFGSGEKKIFAEKKQFDANKKFLLFAFAINEDEVFIKQLFDSRDYSLYKVSLRDSAREEIIVLGLGPIDNKKVQLKEVYIIGEDDTGTVKAMPVKGFVPVNVLNAPLQLNRANKIVFPTQVGEKTVEISWSAAGNEFVVGNALNTSSASSNAEIEKDDSVFEE